MVGACEVEDRDGVAGGEPQCLTGPSAHASGAIEAGIGSPAQHSAARGVRVCAEDLVAVAGVQAAGCRRERLPGRGCQASAITAAPRAGRSRRSVTSPSRARFADSKVGHGRYSSIAPPACTAPG